jgi:hypothetical protein
LSDDNMVDDGGDVPNAPHGLMIMDAQKVLLVGVKLKEQRGSPVSVNMDPVVANLI